MVDIQIGPNLFSVDSFVLSWHGFFSFIAVATAVFLVGRWAPMKKIDPDVIYSIAIWAIIGGVIGARVVHVIDNWTCDPGSLNCYSNNPGQIIEIWRGGIGIWGGILGGFIGGVSSALIMKQPVGVIADLTAPVMLLTQSIGRLGDIVNGEHCARELDHALAWVWEHSGSNASICENGIGAQVHPVVGYEIAWNFISLLIVWKLRNRLRPDGMLWAVYLVLYSIGRFAVTFAREDRIWAFGLQEAQYIALLVLVITVPLLIIKARPVLRVATANGDVEALDSAPRQRGTRAQRRRRQSGR